MESITLVVRPPATGHGVAIVALTRVVAGSLSVVSSDLADRLRDGKLVAKLVFEESKEGDTAA